MIPPLPVNILDGLPPLSENSQTVLTKRYLDRDDKGNIKETHDELFWRVAYFVSRNGHLKSASEQEVMDQAIRYFKMLRSGDFLPNSPTLANAGTRTGQLSACFVIPVSDAFSNASDGIYDALTKAQLIQQTGGGVGYSFSRLRRKGAIVSTTKGIASGPVSFMDVFDVACEKMKQGGCLTPETLVHTELGLLRLSELVNSQDLEYNDLNVKVLTDEGTRNAHSGWNNSIANTLKITLENGATLQGTPNHKVKVLRPDGSRDWVRFDQLTTNDHVIQVMNPEAHMWGTYQELMPVTGDYNYPSKTYNFPSTLNEELAWVLGYLWGDGFVSKDGSYRFGFAVSHNSPAGHNLQNYFQKLFNINLKTQQKPNDGSYCLIGHSKQIHDWLVLNNLDKDYSNNISVPKIIRMSPKTVVSAFISGLIEADGSIHENRPSLVSSSKQLLLDIQVLLTGMGIPAKLSETTKSDNRYSQNYSGILRIYSGKGLERFVQNIPILEGSRFELLNHVTVDTSREMAWPIPNVSEALEPILTTTTSSRESYERKQALRYMNGKRMLKASSLDRLGIGNESNYNEYYWSVKSIEEGGKVLTLDLCVEDNHTYLANGFVSHNTRRGAQMGILRVDHPDILEFIDYKQDLSKLTNFNVSVGVTDDFLKALDTDEEFELVDPADGPTGSKLRSKDVWNRIITRAHSTGEPGIVFLDRMNKHNPTPKLGPYEATNPCWTGNTKVWTIYGPKTFAELASSGEDIPVLSQDANNQLVFKMMRNPRLTKNNAEILAVTLDDGTVLELTPNHNLYLKNGNKVMAKDLEIGASLGSVYRYNANSKGYLRLTNGIDTPMEHHVVVSWNTGRRPNYPTEHCHHIDNNNINNLPDNLEIILASQHNSEHMLGINNPMSGVWDERNPLFGRPTAGQDNGRYRTDIDDQELEALRASGMSYKDIAKVTGCSKYTVMKRLGWVRPGSKEAVANHKVVSITKLERTADVYNGTVDDTHRYFVMCGENDAILSANCGEQPLNPYESCNLGSITLDNMVSYGEDNKPFLDDEKLQEAVWLATQFMDDVVDANEYVPRVPEIRETTLKTRKLGLGIMGLARMLCKLNIAYNSSEGRAMAEHVYAFIDLHSKAASTELARERGAYPYFMDNLDESMEFFRKDLQERSNRALESGMEEISDGYLQVLNQIEQHGIRNSTTTTIAPTGTISMVADTSGGCEPLFALAFKRFQAETQMIETDKIFLAALDNLGLSAEVKNHVLEEVTKNEGSLINALARVPGLPAELEPLAQVFVTAGDISPEDHVLMQAALQKYCDSAISKTVNAPENYTVEETARVYDLALKTNCKGVTIYRNNSRQFQPLAVTSAPATPESTGLSSADETSIIELVEKVMKVHEPRERPNRLFGFNDRIETEQGKLYVQVNYDSQGVREVLANLGKGGGVLSSLVEAIGRLISVALKHHTPVEDLSQSLRGIRGGSPNGFGPKQTLSIPDAIGKVLEASPETLGVTSSQPEPQLEQVGVLYKEHRVPSAPVVNTPGSLDPVRDLGHSPECAECGGTLVFSEGCMSCPRCFTSKCS